MVNTALNCLDKHSAVSRSRVNSLLSFNIRGDMPILYRLYLYAYCYE